VIPQKRKKKEELEEQVSVDRKAPQINEGFLI